MVWTNVGGQNPGDALTSELWNQSYANLEAMADGDSGAPPISVEGALASSGNAGEVLVVQAAGEIDSKVLVESGSASPGSSSYTVSSLPEQCSINFRIVSSSGNFVYDFSIWKDTARASFSGFAVDYNTGTYFAVNAIPTGTAGVYEVNMTSETGLGQATLTITISTTSIAFQQTTSIGDDIDSINWRLISAAIT